MFPKPPQLRTPQAAKPCLATPPVTVASLSGELALDFVDRAAAGGYDVVFFSHSLSLIRVIKLDRDEYVEVPCEFGVKASGLATCVPIRKQVTRWFQTELLLVVDCPFKFSEVQWSRTRSVIYGTNVVADMANVICPLSALTSCTCNTMEDRLRRAVDLARNPPPKPNLVERFFD